jgi:hypothetical protein
VDGALFLGGAKVLVGEASRVFLAPFFRKDKDAGGEEGLFAEELDEVNPGVAVLGERCVASWTSNLSTTTTSACV